MIVAANSDSPGIVIPLIPAFVHSASDASYAINTSYYIFKFVYCTLA